MPCKLHGTTPGQVLDEEEVPQGTSQGSHREPAQVQLRLRQWKAHCKLSKIIKAIMLRSQTLREILVVVLLIVPLITGHHKSSNSLR